MNVDVADAEAHKSETVTEFSTTLVQFLPLLRLAVTTDDPCAWRVEHEIDASGPCVARVSSRMDKGMMYLILSVRSKSGRLVFVRNATLTAQKGKLK